MMMEGDGVLVIDETDQFLDSEFLLSLEGDFGDEAQVGAASDKWVDEFELNEDDVGLEQPSFEASESTMSRSSTDGTDHEEKDKQKKKGRGRPRATEDKKTRNQLACKRHREKRKRDIAELKKKNEDLEKEQEMFMGRIEELTCEIEGLRSTGSIDLEKENLLLRAEIKRHKTYLESVFTCMENIPQPPEEEYRLLKSTVKSSNAQIIGMFHVSLDWKPVTNEFEPFEGATTTATYNFFPENVPHLEVKRVSARTDSKNVPMAADVAFEKLWHMYTSEEALKKKSAMKSALDGVPRNMTLCLPDHLKAVADSLDDKFTVLQYEEGDNKETFVAASATVQEIHPSIIREEGQELIKAYVIATSYIDYKLPTGGPPKKRVSNGHTMGYLIVPAANDDQKCHIFTIGSYKRQTAESSLRYLSDKDPLIVNEKGELHQALIAAGKMMFATMFGSI